ncbi:hypothetical protein C1H46_029605 [Malus baccata]|uniref:Uncharacterized protein n=1 Tax=Malus baccata TaxID=106549 RepID=A0A540LED0_MALBA|nr:hypothetical protein C1H46_029605 [Malus baccata]
MAAACDKCFSCNYMLLEPKDVGFFDLFHILFSNNLERRRFVDSSEETEDDFQRRWLIFLSIVVQKLLQFMAKPVAAIGWGIEMCLNLVSSNQNLVGLLLNLLRGNVIIPDKSSRTFLSLIGNLDKRVELDESIKPGDGKYNAALSMMASKISYENTFYIQTVVQDHWKMEFLGSYDFWNDKAFGEYMEKKMIEYKIRYFRFVYGNDMVPRLPYDDKALMFKHFGTCLYYNRNYEVQVVPEEPNKNYFSPTGTIPMIMNAFGELARSFTIPNKLGPNYNEGPLFKLFRLIGLLLPGAPAHCPQDYVNATRLGSSHVFLPRTNSMKPESI